MARLTVLHYPDPRLRNPAQPVTEVDDSIRRLAADMLETMYDERGIGLAATQVNVAKRIAVIDLSEHRDAPLTLINPEIITTDGTEPSQEGCLSVPGFFETIERAARVRYRYVTDAGEEVEAEADGLMAICLQHEIDHLNGKLFIDHLSPLKRRRFEKKLEKQEKLRAPAL